MVVAATAGGGFHGGGSSHGGYRGGMYGGGGRSGSIGGGGASSARGSGSARAWSWKAEALVTPRPDGIRLPGRRMEDQPMEDQGTAGASRLLTAPVRRQLMAQARLQRTALASPTGSGTASGNARGAVAPASNSRLTANASFNRGGVAEFGSGWRGGDWRGGRFGWGGGWGWGWGGGWGLLGMRLGMGLRPGVPSGIGRRTITAHGGLTIPITSPHTKPDVVNGF